MLKAAGVILVGLYFMFRFFLCGWIFRKELPGDLP